MCGGVSAASIHTGPVLFEQLLRLLVSLLHSLLSWDAREDVQDTFVGECGFCVAPLLSELRDWTKVKEGEKTRVFGGNP